MPRAGIQVRATCPPCGETMYARTQPGLVTERVTCPSCNRPYTAKRFDHPEPADESSPPTDSASPGGQPQVVNVVHLVEAAEAWRRAARMIDDLGAGPQDDHAVHDRLPYVLDLLAAITRTINKYPGVQRPAAFTLWWKTLQPTHHEELTRLRHAALKGLERVAQREITINLPTQGPAHVELPGPVRMVVGEELTVRLRHTDASGSVAQRFSEAWVFSQGPYQGQHVMAALREHLNRLGEVILAGDALLDVPQQRTPPVSRGPQRRR